MSSGRALEGFIEERLTAAQQKLVERVFHKRSGLTHEEYLRFNGEWWGLQDAKDVVKDVIKKADV